MPLLPLQTAETELGRKQGRNNSWPQRSVGIEDESHLLIASIEDLMPDPCALDQLPTICRAP
jgi:hypothetical protein